MTRGSSADEDAANAPPDPATEKSSAVHLSAARGFADERVWDGSAYLPSRVMVRDAASGDHVW